MTWITSKAMVHTYYEKKNIYAYMCATKNLKQLMKKHKVNQIFACDKNASSLFLLEPPLMGSIPTKSMKDINQVHWT